MINLIGFNACWFGLIYFGNNFIPIAIIFLLTHVFIFTDTSREQLFVVVIALLGIFTDTTLSYFKLFVFTEGMMPVWLISLWLCFATTISHSLGFLRRRIEWQVLAGGVAPLNYIVGEGLGVVTFSQSNLVTYLFLAPTWVVLFIVFFALEKKYVINTKSIKLLPRCGN